MMFDFRAVGVLPSLQHDDISAVARKDFYAPAIVFGVGWIFSLDIHAELVRVTGNETFCFQGLVGLIETYTVRIALPGNGTRNVENWCYHTFFVSCYHIRASRGLRQIWA